MSKHPPHPAALIEAVCALRDKKTAVVIAAELGLTKNAVVGIWHRHAPRRQRTAAVKPVGAPKRAPHSKEFLDRVCAMRQDTSARDVAAQCGITMDAVYGIWRKYIPNAPRVVRPGTAAGRPVGRATNAPVAVRPRPTPIELPPPDDPESPDCFSWTTRSLVARPSDGCTFITGDLPHGIYCCEPVVPGKSWCPYHYEVCLIPILAGKPRPYVQQHNERAAA